MKRVRSKQTSKGAHLKAVVYKKHIIGKTVRDERRRGARKGRIFVERHYYKQVNRTWMGVGRGNMDEDEVKSLRFSEEKRAEGNSKFNLKYQ